MAKKAKVVKEKSIEDRIWDSANNGQRMSQKWFQKHL